MTGVSDPFPVDTTVVIVDYDHTTTLGPFRVVRSYWPQPVCELLMTDGGGSALHGS